MNQETKPRQLARDIRSGREGVVMATPEERGSGSRGQFWLRPVTGGTEWSVPREYVQLLGALPEGSAR